MVREVRHFLHDIRVAIDAIEQATTGKSFADYQSETMLRLGLERAIEIISEASRHLPEDFKAMRPEIPWAKIRGTGNILRHEYHGLSEKILWGVIEDEIPKLGIAIAAILQEIDKR